MLIPLLLGCAVVFATMAIQIAAVVAMLNYLYGFVSAAEKIHGGIGVKTYAISMIMSMLFLGHLVQVDIWAMLFMRLGEFSDFATAFYHSMVNFSSLGYGDIVMSERWRLLGAIEASNGVLMFGLSAGTLLSIMSYMLTHYSPLSNRFKKLKK